jgi:hypothetical protein
LSDASATTLPPVGAGWANVTVHVLVAPDITVVGTHASEDTLMFGVTLTVAVAVPPSAAVRVIVWGAVTEPAIAVNVADVAAAGTVTDGGTGSAAALLDDSDVTLPPASAGSVNVIVQVVAEPEVTLAGAHASDATLGFGVTVICVETLSARVAVTVTVCDVVTEPVVTVNVVDVAAAGTRTEPGAGNTAVLLDARATRLPPAGAAWLRVTVHVVDTPETTLVGAQPNDDTVGPIGTTLTVAVALPPNVAVSVTDWVVWTAPAVAVNVADVVPDDTVTDGGTGSAAVLLDASVIALPPAGAAWFVVTVQVVTTSLVKLDGAHASDATLGPLGATLTVAVALPPRVAVTVTVWRVTTELAVAVNVTELAVPGTTTEAGTGSTPALLVASATTLPVPGAG